MLKFLMILATTLCVMQGALAQTPGVVEVRSTHTIKLTMQRLKDAIQQRHLQIAAEIDHSGAAHKAGLSLLPTELVIFGNPTLGTKLMEVNQIAGLALPLKVLVWQDAQGQVWLAYNDPAAFAQQYGIDPQSGPVQTMTKALHAITAQAAES